MQMNVSKWICYAVGYVFITSGIIKLLVSDFKGIFLSLGLPFPLTTLFLVAIIEITCGTLIVLRMHLGYATIPLIGIMIGALYITKLPTFLNDGLLSFAFESRLDIVMLILLLLLWHNRVQIGKS